MTDVPGSLCLVFSTSSSTTARLALQSCKVGEYVVGNKDDAEEVEMEKEGWVEVRSRENDDGCKSPAELPTL